MFVECPHCYTRVIPKPDGVCPACQKNTRDVAGTDPTLASLSISISDDLPPYCHRCGQFADRYVHVKGSRREDSEAPSLGLAMLTTVVSFLFLPFAVFWKETSETLKVSLHLPQCELCAAKHGKPKPEYVNFHRDSMTFIVHKEFKERVLQSRQQRGQTGGED